MLHDLTGLSKKKPEKRLDAAGLALTLYGLTSRGLIITRDERHPAINYGSESLQASQS